MTTEQPSRGLLFAGMLGIAVGACSGSGDGGTGTGGSTAGVQSSGGAGADATGGALASGGSGPSTSGGQVGSGASAGRASGGSSSGGTASSGGSSDTGGAAATGPTQAGSGGSGDTGGVSPSGGAVGTGGRGPQAGRGGSTVTGGAAGAGGRASGGAGPAGGSSGATATGGAAGAGGSGGSVNTGTCTESKPTGTNATGSGPHEVTVETNSDPGISEGTIFRPTDLGGSEKYPIFVWGEGGCSQNGLSNATAMAEIASHGYFVVADGKPNGSGNRTMDRSRLEAMGAPLIAYIDWAIAENEKPCSAYYQSLDTTRVASNGFSCGGLMSQATVIDPRITTWGVNSSGMAGADQAFYDAIHTPVLFVEGGPGDVAYDGGLEGYEAISKLDVPVLWFSKDLGHGGDLFAARGGDFTKINIAWLNWWLKDDETATGKGLLVGADCPYCSDSAWEYMSSHVP